MEDQHLLDELLSKVGMFHPLYGDRLATHLPMVLVALARLGADNNTLTATFDRSVEGLEPVNTSERVTAVNRVDAALGQADQYGNYLRYYQEDISQYGTDAVLRQTLPHLLPGIAASAFHGLIRLAYAIENHDDNEVAIALAFWSAEFQPFELSERTTGSSLTEIMATVAPIGSQYQFSPGIIVDRMSEVAQELTRQQAVIQPESLSLSHIRRFCLQALWAHDDFTLLHTVTGCHAFRIISPYLDNKEQALRQLWQAIVIAYLSTGLDYTPTSVTGSNSQCEFDNIISSALTSTDAHVVKLVYSCYREFLHYRDPMYYALANRAVSQ